MIENARFWNWWIVIIASIIIDVFRFLYATYVATQHTIQPYRKLVSVTLLMICSIHMNREHQLCVILKYFFLKCNFAFNFEFCSTNLIVLYFWLWFNSNCHLAEENSNQMSVECASLAFNIGIIVKIIFMFFFFIL